MPIGPGAYDKECTAARVSAKGRACVLIILGGDRGDGFSCQADLATTLRLAEMLEATAKEIRKSTPFG